VQGAHQVEYKSDALLGVLVEIIDIANTGPGQRPIVTFSLSNKWGPLPPSYLGRLRFSLSGPNDDFAFYAQDDALNALTADGPNWKFQFETPLPNDAMGSFSLGVEGRINSWILNPEADEDDQIDVRDQMQNFIEPFAVTGDMIDPRRMVVDDMKCESCHSNLSLHGENRHNAGGYCQTCHMPSATDEEVREPGDTPQSIDFRYMVHKIHRGADLENGYVVLGYRSSVHDYSHVEYPGDLRNCEACHVDDSYTLPLPANLEMVETPRDFFTPMGPETAACLSCHDSKAAASHALSNSSDIGEACAACHGTGKTYDVEKVHAR
jgi:OmcA/MtrC family decaheme c-type cytochrome